MSDFSVDFMAVGPQRTGTTWLYEMLSEHPRLCFPREVKETRFFDRRYAKGLDWYLWHFEHCVDDQLAGEVAATYFDIPEAAERIYDFSPDCQILIGLRDPVERAFSLYTHHRKKGRVDGSFREACDQMPRIVDSGRYARWMPEWTGRFEEFNCLFLEDVKERPQAVLDEVFEFLGVDPIEAPERADSKVNARTMPRFPALARLAASAADWLRHFRLHRVVEFGKSLGLRSLYSGGETEMPELSEDDRAWLADQYREDIEFVRELTGRELASWAESES